MALNTQAETNKAQLRWGAETGDWGAISGDAGFTAPTLTVLRYVSESLKYNKKVIQSNEIRSDRNIVDQIEVGVDVSGDVNFELTTETFDTWFRSLMANDPIGGATGITMGPATTFAVTAASGTSCTLTDSANGFVSAGIVTGQWIKITGFANGGNNQIAKVGTVAAGSLTLSLGDSTFVNEAAGASVTLRLVTIKNGTTAKSIVIEKQFTDLTNVLEYFTGLRMQQLQLNVTSQQIVTGTWSVMGKRGVQATATINSGGGAATAANTNTPCNATSNVAKILENGVALTTAVRSIQLTVQNNLYNKDVIGSKFPTNIGYGWFVATGQVEFYFEDATLRAKLINHTSTSISFRLTDAASKVIIFTLPAVKFITGDPLVTGPNNSVMLTLDFAALRDSTTSCQLQIDILS